MNSSFSSLLLSLSLPESPHSLISVLILILSVVSRLSSSSVVIVVVVVVLSHCCDILCIVMTISYCLLSWVWHAVYCRDRIILSIVMVICDDAVCCHDCLIIMSVVMVMSFCLSSYCLLS